MNRETIEKAARDYIQPKASIIPVMESIAKKEGFIAGADWRINSVWHEASEEPEKGDEPIFVEYKDWGSDGSDYMICNNKSDYNFMLKRNVPYCTVIRWAYVSDLLPDRKEDME